MQTTCPRCGYDLKGVIGTWRTACPIEGTCSECGLGFRWWEVFAGCTPPPTLSFEHTSVLFLPLSWLWTCLLSTVPWIYWRRLKMTHRIRIGRLVIFVLAAFACAYLAMSAAMVASVSLYLQEYYVPMDFEIHWHMALLPLSDKPLFTIPQFAQIAPVEVNDVFNWLWVAPTYLVFHGLCATAFAVLPASRRTAKVKWSHIARIAVSGVVLVLPLFLGIVAAETLVRARAPANLQDRLALIRLVLTYALAPWSVAWWSLATSRYLRMRHGWGVGLAVVVIAVLVMALIATQLDLSYWGRE